MVFRAALVEDRRGDITHERERRDRPFRILHSVVLSLERWSIELDGWSIILDTRLHLIPQIYLHSG